jgi:propionyl-CoA synthetase
MQKMADHKPYTMPATIDVPAILDEIKQALAAVGYSGGHKG